MNTDSHLEERLRGAAPPPGPPPDVVALWRRARRSRRRRLAATAAAAGAAVGLGGLAGTALLRPGVELVPEGPLAAGAETAEERDARYCAAAGSFLGVAVDPPEADPGEDGAFDAMSPDDLRESHATLTEEFARAADLAPVELADAWAAVREDHAAQGDVWESVGWEVADDDWPALLRELSSLPTSTEADRAVATLADDYEHRCPPQ